MLNSSLARQNLYRSWHWVTKCKEDRRSNGVWWEEKLCVGLLLALSADKLFQTAKSMGPVSELLSWFRGWGQLFSLKWWPWIGLYSFIPQQVLLWLSSPGSDVAVLLAPYESSLSSHPTLSRILSLGENREEKTPSLPWLIILSYWFYLLSKFGTFCSDSLGLGKYQFRLSTSYDM